MYGTKCLITENEDPQLWYKHLEHTHSDFINKTTSKNIVVNLPNIKFSKYKLCDAFQMGNQTRVSFKFKNIVSTSKSLEFLHLDLFRPLRTKSLSGTYYKFVIVNDYFICTWTLFLHAKPIEFTQVLFYMYLDTILYVFGMWY